MDVVRACATVFYYWVTWAPLTRGSAATGYVVLTALMLAAGVELVKPPPPGLQADWEAILRSRPSTFVSRIETAWLGRPGAVRSFLVRAGSSPSRSGLHSGAAGAGSAGGAAAADEAGAASGGVSTGADSAANEGVVDPLEGLPLVGSTLVTLRHMIECLNVVEY